MFFKAPIILFKTAFWFVFVGLPMLAFSQKTNQLAVHHTPLNQEILDSPDKDDPLSKPDKPASTVAWTASLGTTKAVSCAGGNDGSATVVVSGNGPFSYRWDAAAGYQTEATATHLSAGTYAVTVSGTDEYTQVVQVSLTEPSPLRITTQNVYAPHHAQESSGSLSVSVRGGTGTYHYQWSEPSLPNSPVLENLAAGTYELTVTDARGCTSTFGLTLLEPLH